MIFEEVLQSFRDGKKKIRRAVWNKTAYAQIPDDLRGANFNFTTFDLIADDWEIIEPTVTITREQLKKAFWDSGGKMPLTQHGDATMGWTPTFEQLAKSLGL